MLGREVVGLPTVLTVSTTALPVAVEMADRQLADDVVRWVESTLGWQVVADSAALPARLRLVDVASVQDGAAREGAVLIARSLDGADLRHAIDSGVRDVVRWPEEAERLAGLRPSAVVRPAAEVVGVAGAAGGVGTSTVAVAAAAVSAWSGVPTWLVTDGAGRRLCGGDGSAFEEVESLPGLRIGGDLHDAIGRSRVGERVVVDLGVDPRGHVLVARPDASLLAAVRDGSASVVVTVGTGGLHPHEVARAVAGRRHVPLDHSVRVARTGLRGRLPGALPGRLVADLSSGLRAGLRWTDAAGGNGRGR